MAKAQTPHDVFDTDDRTLRAAGYFRVSTERQEIANLSIPDQRKQVKKYCDDRNMILVAEYIEHGMTATNDRRPELQALIERATDADRPYDVVLIHSLSRFFRDAFEMEMYVRKLLRANVRLISITQEFGEGPTSELMRKFVALMDEHMTIENRKHVTRGMKENAEQGFHNGSTPPLGYCAVEAERRGTKIKKKLAIDPVEAETVRLIYKLYREGDGTSGPLGLKNIAVWLNARGYRTRKGGYFGKGNIHNILTNPTYKGEFIFNRQNSKTKIEKPIEERVIVEVPAIIDPIEFDRIQERLHSRRPLVTAPRLTTSPILLTGLTVCASCGGAMTLRTGTSHTKNVYRYYSCSPALKKGDLACKGRSVSMEALDQLVTAHLCDRLLISDRVGELIRSVAEQRKKKAGELDGRIGSLKKEVGDAEGRLKRLYAAIEEGIADLDDLLKERIEKLKLQRHHAQEALIRVAANVGPDATTITEDMISDFAYTMRENISQGDINRRKAYIRAIVQSIEVGDDVIRIFGMKALLEDAIKSKKNPVTRVRSFGPSWCPEEDCAFSPCSVCFYYINFL